MIKDLAVICAAVMVNFIIYYAFGSLVLARAAVAERLVVGFFAYYAVFFFFCVPVMKYYRPLSMLSRIWVVVVVVAMITAVVLNLKNIKSKERAGDFREPDQQLSKTRLAGGSLGKWMDWIRNHPVIVIGFLLLVAVQVVLVSATYNFTLDAAYYVAGVSTNVDTNMINVYDPFTGAWQDHFEMRYFFATYSVQDAVVCQLTGIAPLIWTKSVMATVIIILTNLVYYLIAQELVEVGLVKQTGADEEMPRSAKQIAAVVMLALIFFVNITFHTIYTSSLFLMTRTYEGKAIVGNLAIMSIFYLFTKMNNVEMIRSEDSSIERPWLSLFLICFGASTISSTANMLMPVELTVLFLPLIVRLRQYKWIAKYVVCILPGLLFALTFVLYVKGYFVFYTYPR